MRNSNFLSFRPSPEGTAELPPRDLNGRTRMHLEHMLAGFPQPKRIRVIAVFGDTENVSFAHQIHEHLEDAGWLTEPNVQIVAQSVPHDGIYIRMGLSDTSVIEIVVGSNT
jgi:hypothetical protein